MSFIQLKNVCKSYGRSGEKTGVLDDINLSIRDGEFVAIVGYSGTGKTTLINTLAGLVTPDSGTASMEDRKITGPSPERGLVFQNYSLLPWLTVLDNVQLAIDSTQPRLPASERRKKALHYVSMVNLGHATTKLPHELSGGMRQRVSVARALAMDPKVLLLDEPLSALDALTRSTLQDEIGEIWKRDQKTVVLITNDVDEAILLADRIIPLLPGKNGATLGDSIFVDLPRPRDRKAINHNENFKQLRKQVFHQLISAKPDKTSSSGLAIKLPNIKPREIGSPRSMANVG